MFNGVKAKFGDKEVVIPPLSLGQLRNGALELLKKHDELVEKNQFMESALIRGEVIALALTRNYPEMTVDLVFENLDLSNVNELWRTVIGLSGFSPGERRRRRRRKLVGLKAHLPQFDRRLWLDLFRN